MSDFFPDLSFSPDRRALLADLMDTHENDAHVMRIKVLFEWYEAQIEKARALESEVKAARILGRSSSIAFEFARSQWEDAKKETDRHFGSAYFL